MTLFWYGLFGVFACAGVTAAWRVGPELLRIPRELFRGPWREGLDGGLWFTTALFGAAGAVQVADAVAVGGPGVLPWLWLCALLAAPLFYADAVLSRVAPPGTADGDAPGSLGEYVRRASGSRAPKHAFTFLCTVAALGAPCLVVAALINATVGAPHLDSLPVPAVWLVALVVLLAVALTAVADRIPFGAAGAIGAPVITALFAGAVVHHVYNVPGVLLHSFTEMFSKGGPDAVPIVALSHVLPLFVVWVGISAAVRRRAPGNVARDAALSAVAPLVAGLLLTIVAVGVAVGTNADQPIQTRIVLLDVLARRTVDGGEDTTTKPYTGYERFIDGKMRSPGLRLATERGLIVDPVVRGVGTDGVQPGQPADVAVQFRDGKPFRILEAHAGALSEVSPGAMHDLWVSGGVLPRRSQLLFAEAGDGPAAAWVVLGALLLAGIVAMARWASAVRNQRHGVAILAGQLVVLVVVFGGDPAAHPGPAVLAFFFLAIAPLLAIARYARPRL